MRNALRLCAVLFIAQFTSFCFGLNAVIPPDPLQVSSTFAVANPTQIPGKTLKPGNYTIRLLDHLADRVILRIEDATGKSEGLFVGVPNARLANGSGPVSWPNSGHKADTLRGYSFPGGAVEFIYPKEEAVAIAKVNADKVLAIDPASEGRPKQSKDLSDEDRRMVTLWMLQATRVGPANNSQPAIQAQRYEAPAVEKQVAQQTTTQGPELQSQPAQTASVTSSPAKRVHANTQLATATRPVRLNALPHTASELPLLALAGMLLMGVFVVLRVVRATVC